MMAPVCPRYDAWTRHCIYAHVMALLHLLWLYDVWRQWKKRQSAEKRARMREIYLEKSTQRTFWGLVRKMLRSEQNDFQKYFGMTPSKFSFIHRRVAPLIQKGSKISLQTAAIGTAECLAVTLRYLASGDKMVSLSFAFQISQSSISYIIHKTCKALCQVLRPAYMKPLKSVHWTAIEKRFGEVWNMPNCIGAIDAKNILIDCPTRNHDPTDATSAFSIALLGVADADYRFSYVDIRAWQSDVGGLLHTTSVGKALYDQTFCPFPRDVALPGSENAPPFPHYLVGDETFPLRRHLLRPYPPGQQQLTRQAKVYNYRLRRARRAVECAFGILAAHWRILKRPIKASTMSKAIRIVSAAVCLHNYLACCDDDDEAKQLAPIKRYISPSMVDTEDPLTGEVTLAEWRQQVHCNLTRIGRMGENRANEEARRLRDTMRDYLNDVNVLPWQDQWVAKG